jgi:signal transduction histidine kinase
VSRLPIRLQVTLAFAAALLVVLLAVGAAVYVRFGAELSGTVDRGLEARAAEIEALQRAGGDLSAQRIPGNTDDNEGFALLFAANGRLLDASARAPAIRLTAGELQRARSRPTFADRAHGARDGEPARLLALPSGGSVIVVGTAVDDQRDALRTLLLLGGLGLLAALLLASAAGYWVAGLALRPVEAMRREADAITERPDRRLPVPAVNDELGRLGRTLNAMLARLERARATEAEALAKERRFVADASHELRTPLTIVKAELDVALQEPREPAELHATLESIREEVDRMARLADDLLVLARVDEGRLAIRREDVDLRALLDRVASRNGHRALAVAVRSPPGLKISADPLRLGQAVSNLLDNAARYGAAPVELSAEERDDEVVIGVRDHGPGFPPGFAEHAFERFSRPDGAGRGGGTGLGLAIVAAVADAHGGSAAVLPATHGAHVVIALPSRSAHDAAAS